MRLVSEKQVTDHGVFEFKTLLTQHADEISRHMIAAVHKKSPPSVKDPVGPFALSFH